MASIEKRGDGYRIIVSLGCDIYGKKIRETTTFIPGKGLSEKKQLKAAEEYAIQFEARVKNGLEMEGRKITLKEFTDRWLKEYAPS